MPVINKGLMPAARRKMLAQKMSKIGGVKTGGVVPPKKTGKVPGRVTTGGIYQKTPVVIGPRKPLRARAGGTRSSRSGTMRKDK